MSAKWRRSLEWDRQHFPAWAWPVKFVLQAFSSIWLAVILLTLVAAYGILASIPIGLIALAPTYIVYGLTVLLSLAVGAALPVWLVSRAMRRQSLGRRFAVGLPLAVLLGVATIWAWNRFVWPTLHYDPINDRGLRFFAEFCERNAAITLRRLPGVEMSELEFYSWWPLRIILLAFVLNMITATVRRIEFTFKNLGVLSVHSGIVLIALGSVYYSRLKLEGDTILLAGAIDPQTKRPGVGPPQIGFYDNTRVALHISTGGSFEQRLIPSLPRYNDYNLRALSGPSARAFANTDLQTDTDEGRTLDIPLEAPRLPHLDRAMRRALTKAGLPAATIDRLIREGPTEADLHAIDIRSLPEDVSRDLFRRTLVRNLSFRVVGYSYYAELLDDYFRADLATKPADTPAQPIRFLRALGPQQNEPIASSPALMLLPGTPRTRIRQDSMIAIEYTIGASDARWRDLSEPLSDGTLHALVIEVPGPSPVRLVAPIAPGRRVQVGSTGYAIDVLDILPEPPFPIITPGYENAQSSLVQLRVTTPTGAAFDRWVYHRFPEISQDFTGDTTPNGMPKRKAADPAIQISYLDASRETSLHIDDTPRGTTRFIVRKAGGEVVATESSDKNAIVRNVIDNIGWIVADRWEHSVRIERPSPVPEREQDRRNVGNHDKALLAVEVRWTSSLNIDGKPPREQTSIVWLPFVRYLDSSSSLTREIPLPDGRTVSLQFGRFYHQLPNLSLRLKDFEMIAYDHRGAPRDYQSHVIVEAPTGTFEPFEHLASLNYPLTAPYIWSDRRSTLGNIFGRLYAGLNPNQFKFSQAGWDQQTWRQTQAAADRGEIASPYVQFTILQVGNNPGIHIVALGSILMSLGIPWAFYLKPYLVRREKLRIQQQLARGEYTPPTGRTPTTSPANQAVTSSSAAESPTTSAQEEARA